jgi:hypothetical protein
MNGVWAMCVAVQSCSNQHLVRYDGEDYTDIPSVFRAGSEGRGRLGWLRGEAVARGRVCLSVIFRQGAPTHTSAL